MIESKIVFLSPVDTNITNVTNILYLVNEDNVVNKIK